MYALHPADRRTLPARECASTAVPATSGGSADAERCRVLTCVAMGLFKRGKAKASGPPSAGWYLDPGGSGRWRYWDGQVWTNQFADPPHQDPDDSPSLPPIQTPSRVSAVASPVEAPGAVSPQSDPRQHGRPVPPWSEHLIDQEVVGESYHEAAFRALASDYGHRTVPEYGVELTDARAAIIRDPENPYDLDAVAVCIDGRHLVGHLPRNVAAQYTHRLETLERDTYLEVPARLDRPAPRMGGA